MEDKTGGFDGSPAPWENRDGFVYDSEGEVICSSYGYESDDDLIAAAPELLEALIELTESAKDAIDGLGDLADAIDTAKAAIAKALGQQ
ncbi:hypothetical protein RG265_003347 [Providencia stuartii]